MDGAMIQKMVTEGVEAIVGVSTDPSFGHLIMFGSGGVNAELMNDVAFRLNPLTELDVRELIGSIKMSKLFDGYRGLPPADKPALQDLLLCLRRWWMIPLRFPNWTSTRSKRCPSGKATRWWSRIAIRSAISKSKARNPKQILNPKSN